jgi:hypothetical protein
MPRAQQQQRMLDVLPVETVLLQQRLPCLYNEQPLHQQRQVLFQLHLHFAEFERYVQHGLRKQRPVLVG